VSACRRFPDQKSPPATLARPGLSAPERKAGTQELLAVLAGCGGSQIFTACILSFGRKSPPSLVPVGSRPCCPSAYPQARPPLSPSRRLTEPPAIPSSHRSPRHFAVAFRSYAAPHVRKTPCHIQTIINQPTITHDPRDLFDPTFHFGSTSKVCAIAHVLHQPPLEPLAPRGAGSFLLLRRAARARSSACKRRMGLHPMPRFSRAKPAAAAIRRKRHRECSTATARANRLSRR